MAGRRLGQVEVEEEGDILVVQDSDFVGLIGGYDLVAKA
jgi:hypothetical protein